MAEVALVDEVGAAGHRLDDRADAAAELRRDEVVDAEVVGAEHRRVHAEGIEGPEPAFEVGADVVVVQGEGRVPALGPAGVGEVVEAPRGDAAPEGEAALPPEAAGLGRAEAAQHRAVETRHEGGEGGLREPLEPALAAQVDPLGLRLASGLDRAQQPLEAVAGRRRTAGRRLRHAPRPLRARGFSRIALASIPYLGTRRAEGSMEDLEEGLAVRIDFSKLRRVGEAGYEVVPVVLQDADRGEVLYVGYANELALRETLRTGRAVLWSTSRGELWRKGESSGDVLELVEVRVNCEQNSLLYRVRPKGEGVCHTRDPASGRRRPGCYYRRVRKEGGGLEPV